MSTLSRAQFNAWCRCKNCKDDESCTLYKGTHGLYKGSKIGNFTYNFIKDNNSSVTTDGQLNHAIGFCKYLKRHGFPNIDNIQDLNTFYRDKGSKEENDINLANWVGDFIRFLRDGCSCGCGAKPTGTSMQDNHLSTIVHAYEFQEPHDRVILPRKVLAAAVQVDEEGEDTDPYGYDIDQIELLESNMKRIEYKALILLLGSSGPRIGGIWELAVSRKTGLHNFLKLKDLKLITVDYLRKTKGKTEHETAFDYVKRVKKEILEELPVYQITYYSWSKNERYKTFCSPEATAIINQMLQERRDAGENNPDPKESLEEWMRRNPEAPVFRNDFNPDQVKGRGSRDKKQVKEANEVRISRINNPTPLTYSSMKQRIWKLRNRLGDKVKFTQDEEHHRIPALHGFRHFHKKVMNDSNLNNQVSEWLQGRKLEASEEAYSRGSHPDYTRLLEYWKALPELVIDREKYLRKTIKEKEDEVKKTRDERQRAEDYSFVLSEKQRISDEKRDREAQEQREFNRQAMEQIVRLTALVNKISGTLPEEVQKEAANVVSSSLSLEDKSKVIVLNEKEDDSGGSSGA